MAKKGLRLVTVSISESAVDKAMAKAGFRVGSVGGGTAEYEGMTLLSDGQLVQSIAQRIANEIEII